MSNLQTYYVVFVGHKHGVYNSWVECQKNVLLYKGGVYIAYTSREEVVLVWEFYEPRWRRSDESSTTAKPKFEHVVGNHHSMQNISYQFVISFIVGFFITCVFLIVISILT